MSNYSSCRSLKKYIHIFFRRLSPKIIHALSFPKEREKKISPREKIVKDPICFSLSLNSNFLSSFFVIHLLQRGKRKKLSIPQISIAGFFFISSLCRGKTRASLFFTGESESFKTFFKTPGRMNRSELSIYWQFCSC